MTTRAYDPGNCWSWVMARLGDTIPTAEIRPNSEPKTGAIAIIDYKVRHYAYIEGVFEDGSLLVSECNMFHLYPPGCGYRIIPSDYPDLVGFYAIIEE